MAFQEDDRLNAMSYYEATASRTVAAPRLQGPISADATVVGGGLAGLSAALELRKRGLSVALLEAKHVGWGASGRNGGQVLVGYAGLAAIESQLSKSEARIAWQMSIEGIRIIEERIADYRIDCGFRHGQITLATSPAKARGLHKIVEHLGQTYDFNLTFIPSAQIGAWIASPRFRAGAYDELSGHIHPLKYCLGLADAARKAGVQVFEHSAVIDLIQGDKNVARTELGQVSSRFVVLACNAYLDNYRIQDCDITRRVIPIGSFVIATEPMQKARAEGLIRNRAAAYDTNFLLDYFRVTSDSRMMFGGADAFSGIAPADIRAEVRSRMLTVFPQLSDLKIDYAWGGYVDATINSAPDFGRLSPQVYYLQGFSGHGVALTGLAGRIVAEAIVGQAERFDVFARLRHISLPSSARARAAAVSLGVFYFRMRDLLG
jgi:gamma-glutamylputrescine oxidase